MDDKENKDDKKGIRISSALLNKLKDEQYHNRKRGLREKTYAEMLDEAWEIAHGKRTKTGAPGISE